MDIKIINIPNSIINVNIYLFVGLYLFIYLFNENWLAKVYRVEILLYRSVYPGKNSGQETLKDVRF